MDTTAKTPLPRYRIERRLLTIATWRADEPDTYTAETQIVAAFADEAAATTHFDLICAGIGGHAWSLVLIDDAGAVLGDGPCILGRAEVRPQELDRMTAPDYSAYDANYG